MRYTKLILLFIIIGCIAIFTGFGCENHDITVSHPKEYIWVEEYMALSPLIFPHDSMLIADSVYFPGKIANVKSVSDDDPIPMKSVLYFYTESIGFYIEIYRDDTILVNQYIGQYLLLADTIRFNVGDSIIQDYGYEFINSDLLRFYDFKWPDSNGVTIITIPQDYLLWWGYSGKTEGVFVREEIKE